ncbi:MAG: dienelactone hydrolase family protein [Chthoniobacterales bacterium]|nr:dienelactone hydrolase family protein [Chthoniobacterales bacterium]
MQPPLFLLAPGAGASSAHPLLRHWAALLGELGTVRSFDYRYMMEGSRRPDPLPKLVAAHRAALAEARGDHAGPIVLIGRSMGSRISCHVSLEEKVSALVCLSYPLCGGGDATKLRDKVLREITTPILFVQGTRDPLCPLHLLEQVRREMLTLNQLHVVEGGDHSLLVRKMDLKARGETQTDVDEQIIRQIAAFVVAAPSTQPDNSR